MTDLTTALASAVLSTAVGTVGGFPTVEQLPALLIVLPLLAATVPLALGLFREESGWPVAALVLSVETVLAVWLAAAVYGGGSRIVHVLGGAETFGRVGEGEFVVGIELVADALSGAFVLLVALVSLLVLAFTRTQGPRSNAFYSAYLLLSGGLMGAVLTGDLFNLFVFLEIVGLATYALVASDRSAASAVASLKYLIVGTTGASLYLVGVGYVYVSTGALNMVDVSRSLAGEPDWIQELTGQPDLYGEPLVLAGFAFVATGLLVKTAIFPLHTWQPDAYAEAPDGVTMQISALVSTVSAYALARIVWFVFTPAFFEANPLVLEAVLALAAVSVVAGSALAAMQGRVKRTFAYSSVAQFGLVVLAIGLAVYPHGSEAATRFAVFGAVVHLLAHAVIKSGLFATAGAVAAATGARTVDEYAGLVRRQPFLAGALAVLGTAIVGVPPTIGFVGKWYVALGAVSSGLWWIVLVVFASTLLTLIYVARIVERAFFDYRPGDAPAHAEASTPASGQSGGGGPGTATPVAADGGSEGSDDVGAPDAGALGLPLGAWALPIVAALLALGLGFYGADLAAQFEPVVDALVEGAPEVIPRD